MMNTYSFISRFLDNDIPSVTANFKEFLLKDGLLQMLLSFITQNFPKSIQTDIENLKQQQYLEKMNKLKDLQQNGNGELGFLGNGIDKINLSNTNSLVLAEIPIETIKSKKVMDLFIHPSPPFISLIKEKLSLAVSCLFEIFNNLGEDNNTSNEKKIPGNIHHFGKILNCLFYQFTYEFINQLSEVNPNTGKTYFQTLIEHIYLQPIQDFFVIMAKRASSSVNEYQTSNPIDTKKIQKSLQKSKVFNQIANYFQIENSTNPLSLSNNNIPGNNSSNPNNNEKFELLLSGSTDLVIKIIEELNIYGPDINLPIFCFNTKEFVDNLVRIMYNETRKNTMCQMKLALSIIVTFFNKSIDYTNKNEYQREKDSILSPSGSSSWVLYFSVNHLADICKIMIDIGNNPNLKKNLSSYRLETFNLLIEMIRARSIFKRKSPNQPYLPFELWYFLVDWFFQFNNIYHSKFFQFIQELFSQGHVPSIKHFCSNHLKRFISYYTNESPVNSECRGIILIICNYIRITAAILPATHFLPTYLKSNDQWNKFLPTLSIDTINQYTDIHVDEKDYQSKTYLIDYGSSFADSIGFEDEEKKVYKPATEFPLMVDEFNSSSNNNNINNNININTNAANITKIEEELLKDEKEKKKKKAGKNKKK